MKTLHTIAFLVLACAFSAQAGALRAVLPRREERRALEAREAV
jgi:hypothetical protein